MTAFTHDGLASPLRPVTSQTLTDQATEHLRQAIQTGMLAPGQQLVERELAAQLGMSRVPVREAIQRLVEERLIKRTANHGAIVYVPSFQEIEEITLLRIVLEQFVAESLMQQWSPEIDTALCRVVADMRRAAHMQDRLALANLDTEFHVTTWHIAGHIVLIEVVSGLRTRVARLLYESIARRDNAALVDTCDSHDRLIEVFRSGDAAQAKIEVCRHINAGKDQILAVYP